MNTKDKIEHIVKFYNLLDEIDSFRRTLKANQVGEYSPLKYYLGMKINSFNVRFKRGHMIDKNIFDPQITFYDANDIFFRLEDFQKNRCDYFYVVLHGVDDDDSMGNIPLDIFNDIFGEELNKCNRDQLLELDEVECVLRYGKNFNLKGLYNVIKINTFIEESKKGWDSI